MIKNKITRVKEKIQVKKKITNQRKRMIKEKIQKVNKKLIKKLINTIYKIMIIKIQIKKLRKSQIQKKIHVKDHHINQKEEMMIQNKKKAKIDLIKRKNRIFRHNPLPIWTPNILIKC